MLALVLSASVAYAQGGATASIAGTVVDASGGVVPGVTVTVKNDATSASYEAVTSESGTFVVPALPAGTYSVTVALEGF